ncbi:MAG: ACP phosphodiesterase [Wenzhouxiangellaceae bacterium]
MITYTRPAAQIFATGGAVRAEAVHEENKVMNHLAHLYLAGDVEGWRLGAFLGDHVKGRLALKQWPLEIAQGIELHRAVDSWTDRHPLMREARELAPPPLRRYAGIVLDVYNDHLLSRDWGRYAQVDLQDFAEQAYAMLERRQQQLPPRLQDFSAFARRHNLFARYGEVAVIDRILNGIARRLKRPGVIARGRELMAPHDAELQQIFREFFDESVVWAEGWRQRARSTITGS